MDRKWTRYHSVGVVGLVMLVCFVNWGIVREIKDLQRETHVYLCFFFTLGSLVAFTMVVAHGVTGDFWLGWLIDGKRYTMSLSRLQTALWTALIASCFVTAVSFNIKAGQGIGALDVAIQEELWLAMSINAAALIGSPLLISRKMKKVLKPSSNEAERKAMAERMGQKPGDKETADDFIKSHSTGVVYRNPAPKEASLSDLFVGEEVTDRDVVDLTRLQAFFFTMILVVTYGIAAVGHMEKMVKSGSPISELPVLGASGLAMLGISTTIYMTRKAVCLSPTVQEGS